MAITLSTVNFKYGDPTITAANSPAYTVPTWEPTSGNIAQVFSNNVDLISDNKTIDNKVSVYSSAYAADPFTKGNGIAASGNNLVRSTGSGYSSAFSPVITFYIANQSTIHWSETTFNVDSNTKAVGFNENNTVGNFFSAMWVCKGSSASCRIGGLTVGTTSCVNGDRFKVKIIDGKQVVFYKNYQKIADYWFYPLFKTGYAAVVFEGNSTAFTPTYYLNASPRSSSLPIKSYAVFPVQPNYPYEFGSDDTSISSTAEDQSTVSFFKPGRDTLSLPFNYRMTDEKDLIKNFWDHHTKALPFYYDDIIFKTSTLMKFESGLKITVQRENLFGIQVNLKGISASRSIGSAIADFTTVILSPASGQQLSGTSYQFTSQANSNGSTARINEVEYFAGNLSLGISLTSGNNFLLAVDTTVLTNGTYSITARARTNETPSRFYTSGANAVTVNNNVTAVNPTAPTVSFDSSARLLTATNPSYASSEIIYSVGISTLFNQYTGAITVGPDARVESYYKFKIKAAVNRNESPVAGSPAILAQSNTFTAAPTNPTVNDDLNEFNWTNTPGYTLVSDYELNTGAAWVDVISKPVVLENITYPVGTVALRVKGGTLRDPSAPIYNQSEFTFKPSKPVLVHSDTDNTITASHLKYGSSIELSENNGVWQNYTVPISVGDVNLPAGYYRFRIKAATGRSVSDIENSLAFTSIPGGGAWDYATDETNTELVDESGNQLTTF